MTINRTLTFKNLEKAFGKLNNTQVANFNLFFDRWDGKDKRHLSYILATCWHEVGGQLNPIEEIGKGRGKKYGMMVAGKVYYGRGHVQTTWFYNYEKLRVACKGKWDFIKHPELLLQKEPSIWATFYGMNVGIWTGKKLSDYFNSEREDPIKARKIINGTDCAEKIAGHYKLFMKSIV